MLLVSASMTEKDKATFVKTYRTALSISVAITVCCPTEKQEWMIDAPVILWPKIVFRMIISVPIAAFNIEG